MVPYWLKILALFLLWPVVGLVAVLLLRDVDKPEYVIYAWLAVGLMLLVLISIHHARRPDRWDRMRG